METIRREVQNLLYPELRPYERADRDRLLKEATNTQFDLLEWIGILVGLFLVVGITRYSAAGLGFADRVAMAAVNLLIARGPIEVVLLNIQPRPQEWRLRGYGWFHREAIHDRLINDLGERIVRSASRHLKAAAIAYRSRIEIGEIIETTVRCAREEDCDLLVLAERPSGVVRRWLMSAFGLTIGSISSIAVHFVRSPVIAIK
jgi:nucleotide-binding universal stress UspA family protein